MKSKRILRISEITWIIMWYLAGIIVSVGAGIFSFWVILGIIDNGVTAVIISIVVMLITLVESLIMKLVLESKVEFEEYTSYE